MTLDINYTTTNPRNVDKILEAAIEQLQTAIYYPTSRTSAGIIEAMQKAQARKPGSSI